MLSTVDSQLNMGLVEWLPILLLVVTERKWIFFIIFFFPKEIQESNFIFTVWKPAVSYVAVFTFLFFPTYFLKIWTWVGKGCVAPFSSTYPDRFMRFCINKNHHYISHASISAIFCFFLSLCFSLWNALLVLFI